MSKFNRILFPVDLSKNSLSALGLATQIAKQTNSKICFFHVSPLIHGAFRNKNLGSRDENLTALDSLRPTDETVECEHIHRQGNIGPSIVEASKTADLCLMTTHGRQGVSRVLMGSIAQYVLRYAKCPVIIAKGFEEVEPADPMQDDPKHFATEIMHPVAPIHEFEPMQHVLAELKKANQTAAPVVDDFGRCIGILTMTDIESYQQIRERFNAGDKSVVEAMFTTDKYGQRRTNNDEFEQVKRHMTKNVIYANDDDTIKHAIDVLEVNPQIHHLVVLDSDTHPIGIIDSTNLFEFDQQLLEAVSTNASNQSTTTDD